MTDLINEGTNYNHTKLAKTALKAAAKFWFCVTVLGQGIFIYYIIGFYGSAALDGNFEKWNEILPHGYVEGQTRGNIAVGMHLLFAALITFGGALQLIPKIRNRFPTFHHWNGRIYILTAFIMSFTGLYMSWGDRDTVGDLSQAIAISIDGILIIICAIFTIRYAIARDISKHRRWALRLFVMVSGVWFFRIGLMLWLTANGGPVGFDYVTFTGPFLTILSFTCYCFSFGILEVYIRAKEKQASPQFRYIVAGGLISLTLAMCVGIFSATMGMWLPRL